MPADFSWSTKPHYGSLDPVTGAALDVRAGTAGRLGWLPGGQIDCGNASSNPRARAGPRDRAMALRSVSPKATIRTAPTHSPKRRKETTPRNADKRECGILRLSARPKGQVFCLRGASELISLDGDTGAVDWSFSAPPGQINPNFLDRRRSNRPTG